MVKKKEEAVRAEWGKALFVKCSHGESVDVDRAKVLIYLNTTISSQISTGPTGGKDDPVWRGLQRSQSP